MPLNKDQQSILVATRDHGDPRAAKRAAGIGAVTFDALTRGLVHAGLLKPVQLTVDDAPYNTLALTEAGAAAIA